MKGKINEEEAKEMEKKEKKEKRNRKEKKKDKLIVVHVSTKQILHRPLFLLFLFFSTS